MTESLQIPRVARWWHPLDDGRLSCDLCPRHCTLRDGQRGFCFHRVRRGDQIVLEGYGRTSGIGIDPVEKKPLNHVMPGHHVLSFGTLDCNLACRFCQNWQISTSTDAPTMTSPATPSQITDLARKRGCIGVAYTYNDPVIFAEYALDTADQVHQAGLINIAVTAGYINAPARDEFFSAMDAVNIDLKGFTDDFYRRITGAKRSVVLETITAVAAMTDTWLELTTLLIPGLNDGRRELTRMCDWILREIGPDVPLHFTAFHPDNRMRGIPRTPAGTLTRARELAMDAGLHYVYTGNVYDPRGQTTWCPVCGAAVIERDAYRIEAIELTDAGCCTACGAQIPGVFQLA